MTTGHLPSTGADVRTFTVCVLAIMVPIETVYSWRLGLTDPYYLVKLVGWLLLAWGASSVRGARRHAGVAFLAAGWGWLAANYWRAVADRVTRMAAGETLRLGSIELWFAGGCLVVSLVGLAWSLSLTSGRFPKA
jgi:hypothetical protein